MSSMFSVSIVRFCVPPEDLLFVCAAHFELHIVSCIAPGVYINDYDPRGLVFMLGEGYRNPHYGLNIGFQWSMHEGA